MVITFNDQYQSNELSIDISLNILFIQMCFDYSRIYHFPFTIQKLMYIFSLLLYESNFSILFIVHLVYLIQDDVERRHRVSISRK